MAKPIRCHRIRVRAVQPMLARVAVSLITFLIFTPANASLDGIQSTTGDIAIVSAPSSVRRQDYESDAFIRVFKESEQSASSIPVNAQQPGKYNAYADFTDVDINPAGPVRSYFIHFDPASTTDTIQLSGSITFDAPILAVIARSQTLEDTDGSWGVPGTLYPTNRFDRELEYQNRGNYDFFRLEADNRTITVQMECSTDIDQIRVITAVPEPAMAWLAAMVLIGVAGRRRRSRGDGWRGSENA